MKHIILIFSFFGGIISGGVMNGLFPDKDGITRVLDDSSGPDTTRYIYIGAEACATKCHNSDTLGYQYNTWKGSRHSKSYESLTGEKALIYCKTAGIAENPWESLTCLKCHITAAGYDLSSLGATYKKEDGVTCEGCHKSEFIPKTFLPKVEDCLKCHNNSVHEVSSFDFKQRCLKISHPRPKTKLGIASGQITDILFRYPFWYRKSDDA
jgi:Cytochrome c554 and c-prime